MRKKNNKHKYMLRRRDNKDFKVPSYEDYLDELEKKYGIKFDLNHIANFW